MSKRTLALSLILALAATLTTFAQPGGGPPDFNAMRKLFADRMKEQLGASDEEWKALQPVIEHVQQLQRDAGGGMRMMFGPGGPGGPGSDQPLSPTQQKSADLQATLQNESANADEIKGKLAALREARSKAKAELAKAQDALRELLTQRQEAVLVMMNVLE